MGSRLGTSLHPRKVAVFAVLAVLAFGLTAFTATRAGASSKSGITIGFSQGLPMNSYHQVMVKTYNASVAQLKKEGKVASSQMAVANGNASTQVSQINALILKKVDVLVIDPASTSALNASIERATKAGIKVLIFNDGPVTTKSAYELNFDLAAMMKDEGTYIANRLKGKGNVLSVRGVAGTGSDDQLNAGVKAAFKPHAGIKVVSEVYGEWDNSTTQSKVASVLPSLPSIDAIIDQGGETYGAIQAFQAAGRKVPIVVFGNRGLDLKWWYKEWKKSGFTAFSDSANPGIGSVIPYVAYHLANGDKVPKNMVMPTFAITQAMMPKFKNTPTGGLATNVYDDAWVKTHLLNQ
jgi:ribose transport system substrate-binding protein